MRRILLLLMLIGLGKAFAQDEILLAERLTSLYQYKEASRYLEMYIEDHGDRRFDLARAWCLLSYNYMRQGMLVEAREANETSLGIRRALRVQELGENFLRAAQIALKQGDTLAAKAYIEQSLQMLVEDTELLVEMYLTAARIQALQHTLVEMNQSIETALAIMEIELEDCQASLDQFYLTIARLYFKAKDYNQAAYWYEQTFLCSDDMLRKGESLLYRRLSGKLSELGQ